MDFKVENEFYKTTRADRIGKLLEHYELYKMIVAKPGEVIELGVFKGNSLKRWAFFRELLETRYARNIIGFDTFAEFPKANSSRDEINRKSFVEQAGIMSVSKEVLEKQLKEQDIYHNVELVKGDAIETIPEFNKKHPELRIALLHLDIDVYEPTKLGLEFFYPRMVQGGIVILDNYGVFYGENNAIEEYFKGNLPDIKKFSMSKTPCYFEVKK